MKFGMTKMALVFAVMLCTAMHAFAVDDAHVKKAEDSIKKGIEYLLKVQNEDGSWMKNENYAITKPAVTGLALTVLFKNGYKKDHPAVRKGLDFLKSQYKGDGTFSEIMPNYNTALPLLALGAGNLQNDDEFKDIVKACHEWAKASQWQEGKTNALGHKVDKDHRFYGGFGYGKHGRPDMSNTSMMLEALHDSGFDCADPVFQRAITFLSRHQGTELNDKFAKDIVPNGGFIYCLSLNTKSEEEFNTLRTEATVGLGKGMKAAGKDSDGNYRLQTYGAMTYAGYKSFIYADTSIMPRDDPRLKAIMDWSSKFYTVERHANVGMQGYYYYLQVLSRAKHASGEQYITLSNTRKVDWANDIIRVVADLQKEDGSWVNETKRWMEDQPDLVSTWALLALTHAKNAPNK